MRDGSVVGTVTSGDWGHRVGLNLAYAFIEPSLAAPGTEIEIDMCGQYVADEVIPASPFDPEFTRVRA